MGLVPSFEAFESAVLGFTDDPRLGRGPFLDHGRMMRTSAAKMEQYDVRPQAPRLKTSKFSGGNQQKIVLAREIEREPRVLLVGQPTRGVDIGAIEFIHRRLIALRDAGVGILLVSVELDEIMACRTGSSPCAAAISPASAGRAKRTSRTSGFSWPA